MEISCRHLDGCEKKYRYCLCQQWIPNDEYNDHQMTCSKAHFQLGLLTLHPQQSARGPVFETGNPKDKCIYILIKTSMLIHMFANKMRLTFPSCITLTLSGIKLSFETGYSHSDHGFLLQLKGLASKTLPVNIELLNAKNLHLAYLYRYPTRNSSSKNDVILLHIKHSEQAILLKSDWDEVLNNQPEDISESSFCFLRIKVVPLPPPEW